MKLCMSLLIAVMSKFTNPPKNEFYIRPPLTAESEEWLINRYTFLGIRSANGDLTVSEELREVGDELRAYNIGLDLLKDYSGFER